MRTVFEKLGKNVRADRIELEISGHYKTKEPTVRTVRKNGKKAI